MKKNISGLALVLIVILLSLTYTIASTYAVIINLTSDKGINEIVNRITIRDLVTDDNGNYNNIYYDIKDTLNITADEANILINSNTLDETLQVILDSVVEYRVNNNDSARILDDEICNMIEESSSKDNNISDELRSNVVNKCNIYKSDIGSFLYDLEISILGGE